MHHYELITIQVIHAGKLSYIQYMVHNYSISCNTLLLA